MTEAREKAKELAKKLSTDWVSEAVTKDHALSAGIVFCLECGRRKNVDSAKCLSGGWPKCCGATMSLSPPVSKIAVFIDKQWEDAK